MLENWKKAFGLAVVIVLAALGILLGSSLTDPAWAQRSANVKDVENPDKQAIVAFGPLPLQLSDGLDTVTYCSPDAVPAGKRWIIEHVTAHASMPSGEIPALQIYLTSPRTDSFLPLTLQGGPFAAGLGLGTVYVWNADQLTKLRVDAGGSFCVMFTRGNGYGGTATLLIGFSGYEINYP